ncbi:MAG: NYN domain-containing protein [Weeksellaceae bacterium]|nr:NYN domain-containing protein [Weeksellaceae bacterium]
MGLAGIFIDYENIHYYLNSEYQNPPEIGNYAQIILRSLREFYEEDNLSAIVMNAYADFERLGSGAMSTLYLMGILTKNVLGTEHKNAADMQMCIDILETMYSRKDINHYLIVAGDRDYIPVVQHLRRQGKIIKVAAFRKSVSGDLLEIIGKENFIELEQHIPEESMESLNEHLDELFRNPVENGISKNINLKIKGRINLPEDSKRIVPNQSPSPKKIEPVVSSLEEMHHKFLRLILEYIDTSNYAEPGMGPLLRHITDYTHELPNWERKHILETLRQKGVINIVQKDLGYEFPISVVQLNRDHPMYFEI